MSDFFSGFWSYFISIIALGGIVFCVWLLFSQRAWLKKEVKQAENTGHVWDGNLSELNNPVPRWWTVFYLGLCVFALGYLVLYPGLGRFQGVLQYSSAEAVREAQRAQAEQIRPVYARYERMTIPQIAGDREAQQIGQRLFLNNCAQCHGSDARGGPSFPNLTDGDWLYGGTPDVIQQTITHGRHGIMPPWKASIDAATASDIAHYVRSLSGLAADPIKVFRGQREFGNVCVACHGVDGKGNQDIGAPDLTDDYWLYGNSRQSLYTTITEGRHGSMPAHRELLGETRARLVAAYVWSLSHDAAGAKPGAGAK